MRNISERERERDIVYGMSHSSAQTRENEAGCLLSNCAGAQHTWLGTYECKDARNKYTQWTKITSDRDKCTNALKRFFLNIQLFQKVSNVTAMFILCKHSNYYLCSDVLNTTYMIIETKHVETHSHIQYIYNFHIIYDWTTMLKRSTISLSKK